MPVEDVAVGLRSHPAERGKPGGPVASGGEVQACLEGISDYEIVPEK